MNIVSAVANMQKELDYYKSSVKECQAVIKQLHEGVQPGEAEYIHPIDLGEIFQAAQGTVEVIKFRQKQFGRRVEDREIVEVFGKKYKQSVFMPVLTKNPAIR